MVSCSPLEVYQSFGWRLLLDQEIYYYQTTTCYALYLLDGDCPSNSSSDCFQFVKEKLGRVTVVTAGREGELLQMVKKRGSCYKCWVGRRHACRSQHNALPIPTACALQHFVAQCNTSQNIATQRNTSRHNAFPILIACATWVATIAIQWLGQSTVQCFTCCHNATQ